MSNEIHNLHPGAEIFRWQPAAWLRVAGEDAFTFLQGQFSNDLRAGEAGSDGVYGLWLNHKGRVLADSFVVWGAEEEFWVGSYFSSAATIRERLEAYVIADDVEIADVTAEWVGFALFNAEREVARAIGGPGARVFRGRRAREVNWEILVPAIAADDVAARLGGRGQELSREQMELKRIQASIAAVPLDLGPGELPNEGGLETAGVSYSKGCYLGQEVMARLKSMGQVRRRLMRVRGRGQAPVVATALFQGEKRVGELRTTVASEGGYVGLALMSLLNFQHGVAVSTEPGGEPTIEVAEEHA